MLATSRRIVRGRGHCYGSQPAWVIIPKDPPSMETNCNRTAGRMADLEFADMPPGLNDPA